MTTGATPRNRSSSQPGLAPTNDAEPAIIRSVEPGSYTAIVRGEAAALVSRWAKLTTCSSERARITAVPGEATLPTELRRRGCNDAIRDGGAIEREISVALQPALVIGQDLHRVVRLEPITLDRSVHLQFHQAHEFDLIPLR